MIELQSRIKAFTQLTGKPVKQVLVELRAMYCLVHARRPGSQGRPGGPEVFVEVGSAFGGSLYVYAGACAPGATIIALDAGRQGGQLSRTVVALREQGYDVHWVRGDSHSPATQAEVRKVLAGRRADFLHIDGDHSKSGVLRDCRDYIPMVRAPGGLVALHDIAFRRGGAQVYRAWPTVRELGCEWCEIIGPPWHDTEYRVGIGVIWT